MAPSAGSSSSLAVLGRRLGRSMAIIPTPDSPVGWQPSSPTGAMHRSSSAHSGGTPRILTDAVAPSPPVARAKAAGFGYAPVPRAGQFSARTPAPAPAPPLIAARGRPATGPATSTKLVSLTGRPGFRRARGAAGTEATAGLKLHDGRIEGDAYDADGNGNGDGDDDGDGENSDVVPAGQRQRKGANDDTSWPSVEPSLSPLPIRQLPRQQLHHRQQIMHYGQPNSQHQHQHQRQHQQHQSGQSLGSETRTGSETLEQPAEWTNLPPGTPGVVRRQIHRLQQHQYQHQHQNQQQQQQMSPVGLRPLGGWSEQPLALPIRSPRTDKETKPAVVK
ncbi:unnamed protein product [Protopolystoma xenopodis]|uniref:Uncharacterized protein n=1 Tax=Protopolystoma xenopodis TaxID=117903 RepID=A0A3S5A1L3_9PLAT|nr:unnamed protein product [Protopolystoma xenopodis]